MNTKLAKTAEKFVRGLGADARFVDLGSYDLPVYNQDTESSRGIPTAAVELKSALAASDGWIVASPEYNGFVTPLLLNAFTWCSRGDPPGAPMYATFQRKTAVVLSASPGAMGGMRSLNPGRQLLQNLGVNVLPGSVAVGGAFDAFDQSGDLVNEKHRTMLEGAVESLFYLTRDEANREATCQVVRAHSVGEYGAVDVAT